MAEKIPLPPHLVNELSLLITHKGLLKSPGDTVNPLFIACKLVADATGIQLAPFDHVPENASIETIATISNFCIRRVALKGDWLQTDNGALLAFQKQTKQPCALLPKRNGDYELIDPVDMTSQIITKELAENLEEEAFLFYRTFKDEPLDLKKLFSFALFGLKRDAWQMISLQFVFSLLALLVPIATGKLFGEVIPDADSTQLLQWLLALLVNVIIMTLFFLSQSLTLLHLRFKLNVSLQSALMNRLLHLPLPFIHQFTVGDLVMRSTTMDTLQQSFTANFLNGVINGVFAFVPWVFMFYFNILLGMAATLLTLIIVGIYAFSIRAQIKYQRELLEQRSHLAGWVIQFLSSISKIRTTFSEKRVFSVWAEKFITSIQSFFKSGTIAAQLSVFSASVTLITTIVIFALANAQGAALSFGDFIAFNSTFGLFMGAIFMMTTAVVNISLIFPLYERAKPILSTVPEQTSTGIDPLALSGKITLSQLTHHYNGKEVLQNISMTIEPGKFIAIVGSSGAGKSTLVRLLLGFEQPTNGHIFYDDHDLASLNLSTLRRKIGVVLQNDALLPGTILENICCAIQLNEAAAWKAAKLAAVDHVIKALPMGMQTILVEGGKSLSVGERQRLIIARALLHQPRMLILDEATSALDNITQATIHRHLATLRITRIIIAQRLSTIRDADCIYVLKEGQLVQSGRFEELINQKGLFAELFLW